MFGDRPLGVSEMRSLLAARNVKRLYAEWSQAKDRLVWEFDHPEFAGMLDAIDEERDHADA